MSHHVWVYTFKEGLLSRVAHDLRLHVERFTITVEQTEVHARFEANSLIVDGTMQGERFDPGGLGARDKAKIVETIRDELLQTRRYPTIEYRGTLEVGTGIRVAGELEMLGVRRPLVIAATREGERVRASVTVRPSEFGLAPYKALAGAIRLQDRVRVELDLDATVLG
jgi:hypothetical protein